MEMCPRFLREVLNVAPDDLLEMWLGVDGPERIVEFLAQYDSSLRFPKSAVHPCETCRWLYASARARTLLVRHYHKVEKQIVERFMHSLALVELERNRLRASMQERARGQEVRREV